MNRQFTRVIVPIHDAQLFLRERILNLMEVVSELTDQFQIRIVDDHSTDSSLEQAYELARLYPQISVSEQPVEVGLSRAAELEASTIAAEDFVFIHDITYPLRVSFFRRLWECRNPTEHGNETNSEEAGRQSRFDPTHDSEDKQPISETKECQIPKFSGKPNPYILNPSDQSDVIQQLTDTLNGK